MWFGGVASAPDPMDREIVAMIELAMARSGYQHKVAAEEMGKDDSQFSRELGTGMLRVRDLFRLNAGFWREYLVLLGPRFGLEVSSEDVLVRAVSDAMEVLGRVTKQLTRSGGRPRRVPDQDVSPCTSCSLLKP